MVEPETFEFLAELAQNNRKSWVDEHREEFDDARRNFTGIAMTLHSYADRFDSFVAGAASKPKQSYTKLYQDPRHRSGPGLYRTAIDVFANAGHQDENFGYYLHIEPGNCYAGAGLYHPSKAALVRFRKRLVEDPQGLTDLLAEPEFTAMFPDGVVSQKTFMVVPEGFDNADPAAPYLKMLGFECRRTVPDALLLEDEAMDQLIEIFRAANPLVRFFD